MVGEVIAADSKFNLWAANVKREHSNLTPDHWFETLELYESVTAECALAAERFSRDADGTSLLKTLSEVVTKLNHRPYLG